ncbi:MAG: glucodextranase DOMON-like domain-containing protein [Elusimicrobiota bacterium]|nr:glucodextranase DOMON-like domain-containing protein [Elusimicrobiota bacterium]
MQKTLAALALSFIFPAPCVIAQGAAQQAILWVPADTAGAGQVIAALELDGGLRLTAALSSLPKDLEERVKKLEKEGRLELALRPAGDPPLPLLYYPAAAEVKWSGKPSSATLPTEQYFLALRLSLARDAALTTFKKTPAGLVSPPGGLAADYFPLAGALGVKWLATGLLAAGATREILIPGSGAAAVLESGGIYAVPFINFSTAAALRSPAFTLFDETSSPDPAALRAMLLAELKASVFQKRVTVSEALKTAVSTAATPAEIAAAASPWAGDYTPWASAAVQAGALAALAQTRAGLMLHLNAAQGNYAQAAPAFEEYFSAENGGKLRSLASADAETASETEIEIRNALGNAYRLMQKPPPPWVFSSLADAASGPAQADKMQVTKLPGGFEIKNVSRLPQPPAKTSGLPGTADPNRIWKLDGLRVESSTEGIVFQFVPLALDNAFKKNSGFSHVRLDLYIDVNHRPRAGMTRPLAGRPLRLFPENAWEYALEATPSGAALYKTTPKGPVCVGALTAKAEAGRITVRVPAALLKGNPALWSYAALMLAPKDGGGLVITDYIADEIANGYIYAVRPGSR